MQNSTISRTIRLYTILTTIFCVVSVLSNLITVKLFQAPFATNLALPTGMLTYPLTFLISDLVTELFGTEKARFMVILGVCMNFLAHLIIVGVLKLPAHELTNQQAIESVFGMNAIAVYTSMIAYVIGQMIDVYLFSFFKKLTGGNHLWFRNNASTLISQLFDTIFVNVAFLYYGLGLEMLVVIKIAFIAYLYKGFISIANTPLFYIAVNTSKKYMKEYAPCLV